MKRLLLRGLLALLVLLALVAAGLYVVGQGRFGRHEGPGTVTERARPAEQVATAAASQRKAAAGVGAASAKQILFGDLHVHTTLSFDAFALSLPLVQGEGSHPQADACDFARFCSALDFWSINDHAEALSPQAWQETIESIRQCNAVSGEASNPDTVAFLGWEWTQVGATPDEHYGHKNVVLAGTGEDEVPPMPIAARGVAQLARSAFPGPVVRGALTMLGGGDPRYHDFSRFVAERAGLPECAGPASSETGSEPCMVTAETPPELFAQLDAWGHDAIVIPHGTTWGFYTPSESSWDKQLRPTYHDPARQTLFEIYSGHGTSEEYREWRGVVTNEAGEVRCPAPETHYLPRCWRAGEIVRERCLAAGEDETECESRAVVARQNAAEARGQAHLTIDGYVPEEWLDAGQCRDCAQPAFNYRPGGAAQYVLALRNFDDPNEPLRFRFGFMSSSDNHFARPGTGYKEVHRRGFTESRRVRNRGIAALSAAPETELSAESRPFDRDARRLAGFQLFEGERQASFFMTGGLAAVHADARDRAAVWDALQRREVYGTSGPRILLWFDLLNAPGSRGRPLPMGSEVAMRNDPIFQARAVGSFEQRPGCPDYATASLDAERLEHLCKGACYNPGDRRRRITRIEVIRVRPQAYAEEPVGSLIDDPWRVFDCEPDPAGCVVTFADPDFARSGRDALYYVRALEEPKPGINAGGVRCEYDDQGRCLSVDLCGAPDSAEDDCLAMHEPRAWSSPIFVDSAAPGHAAR